jgi:hypothetical protein
MLNVPVFYFRKMGSLSKNILFTVSGCGVKKVKLTTLEQAMKTQRRVDVYLYSFFNFGARGGVGDQRHVLSPGTRPVTHCTGGWVDPQALCGRMRKILSPIGIRSPTV